MNHCSSEGATVGIQSYLSSRLKISVQNKQFQNPKQFQFNLKSKYVSISISIFKIIFQTSFSIQHQIQKSDKMTDTNHLSDRWEHTIVKVFKHDSKYQLGLMLKQWIIFNKLENFISVLNYPIDDFTPSGNLCYMNEYGDILPYTPMKKIFNLKWYIQYLIDESEDEDQNPLSEEDWMKQNNCKFMKYVIHH